MNYCINCGKPNKPLNERIVIKVSIPDSFSCKNPLCNFPLDHIWLYCPNCGYPLEEYTDMIQLTK